MMFPKQRKFKIWDYSPSHSRLLLRCMLNAGNIDLVFTGVDRIIFDKITINDLSLLLKSSVTTLYDDYLECGAVRAAMVHVFLNDLNFMDSSIHGTEMFYGENITEAALTWLAFKGSAPPEGS